MRLKSLVRQAELRTAFLLLERFFAKWFERTSGTQLKSVGLLSKLEVIHPQVMWVEVKDGVGSKSNCSGYAHCLGTTG